MKHILNNLTEEEKNAIREQHTGGMKVMNENFSKLVNTKLGDVKPMVNEDKKNTITLSDYVDEIEHRLEDKFDLTPKELDEIIEYYYDEIYMSFHEGYSPKSVVNSWVKDGKLKWKR